MEQSGASSVADRTCTRTDNNQDKCRSVNELMAEPAPACYFNRRRSKTSRKMRTTGKIYTTRSVFTAADLHTTDNSLLSCCHFSLLYSPLSSSHPLLFVLRFPSSLSLLSARVSASHTRGSEVTADGVESVYEARMDVGFPAQCFAFVLIVRTTT